MNAIITKDVTRICPKDLRQGQPGGFIHGWPLGPGSRNDEEDDFLRGKVPALLPDFSREEEEE